jgi:transcriptional regulator with PAS, ATPase and Fis domain
LKEETLRKDFYYRLNVINIQVPTLRERKEDISLLAEHFLNKYLKSSEKEINGFTNEVIGVLENHSWPGNVRELENIIERAVTLAKDNKITISDLPPHFINSQISETSFDGTSLTDLKHKAIEEIEKKFLVFLMQKYKGNVTRIAADAGLTRRHIHRMINNYKIDPNIWREVEGKE